VTGKDLESAWEYAKPKLKIKYYYYYFYEIYEKFMKIGLGHEKDMKIGTGIHEILLPPVAPSSSEYSAQKTRMTRFYFTVLLLLGFYCH